MRGHRVHALCVLGMLVGMSAAAHCITTPRLLQALGPSGSSQLVMLFGMMVGAAAAHALLCVQNTSALRSQLDSCIGRR